MKCRYSMIIQWSNEDEVYVVSLPEFGPYCSTHGETYKEAAKHGLEALESLIDAYQAEARPLPPPALYGSAVATVRDQTKKVVRTKPKNPKRLEGSKTQ